VSFLIKKGSTDVTRYIVLGDSTTGAPETGYTITNLDLQYTRNRATPAAKVDAVALAATDTAHTDNRAIEVDATSSPGVYRVDWPDAAFATGSDKVTLVVTGTGLHPAVEEIQLVDFDPEDAFDPSTDTVILHADYDAAKTAASQASVNTIDTNVDDIETLLALIDADVTSILADTGTDGVVLASGAIGSIHDEVIEGALTHRQVIRLVLAAVAGKLSGAATTTVAIRDVADAKDRITATVDADGNRTAVTLDAT
jgi:hypothetical protein